MNTIMLNTRRSISGKYLKAIIAVCVAVSFVCNLSIVPVYAETAPIETAPDIRPAGTSTQTLTEGQRAAESLVSLQNAIQEATDQQTAEQNVEKDKKGRILKQTFESGDYILYTYDASGYMTEADFYDPEGGLLAYVLFTQTKWDWYAATRADYYDNSHQLTWYTMEVSWPVNICLTYDADDRIMRRDDYYRDGITLKSYRVYSYDLYYDDSSMREDSYDGSGNLIAFTVINYDNEGEVVEISQHHPDGSLGQVNHYSDGSLSDYQTYKYIDNGNGTTTVRVNNMNSSGRLVDYEKRIYDAEGKITKADYYNKKKNVTKSISYSYDNDGSLISYAIAVPDMYGWYDATRTSFYDANDVMTGYSIEVSFPHKFKMTYDAEGVLVRSDKYDMSGASLVSYVIYSYVYSEEGSVVKADKYEGDGKFVGYTEVAYDNDGKHREIAEYDSESKLLRISEYDADEECLGTDLYKYINNADGTTTIRIDHLSGGNGSLIDYEKQLYDASGLLAKIDYYNKNDHVAKTILYYYDYEGKLTTYAVAYPAEIGWDVGIRTDYYNNDNQLTGYDIKVDFPRDYKYTYDAKGVLLRGDKYFQNGTDLKSYILYSYTYSNEGSVVRADNFDGDGTFVGYTEVTYDNNGMYRKIAEYYPSGEAAQINYYDSNQNLQKYETYRYAEDESGTTIQIDHHIPGGFIVETDVIRRDADGETMQVYFYDTTNGACYKIEEYRDGVITKRYYFDIRTKKCYREEDFEDGLVKYVKFFDKSTGTLSKYEIVIYGALKNLEYTDVYSAGGLFIHRRMPDGVLRTFYVSGFLESETLPNADDTGVIFYHYKNEDLGGRGFGRIDKLIRSDGIELIPGEDVDFILTGSTLIVIGTYETDDIAISEDSGVITVTTPTKSVEFITPIDIIDIYSLDGDDSVGVSSGVFAIAGLFGGNGNDELFANNSGEATLVGGDGRDLVVSINGYADKVVGSNEIDSIWVDAEDTIKNVSSSEVSDKAIHRVEEFYQPFTDEADNPNYVPLTIAGQSLIDPTDSGSTINVSLFPLFYNGQVSYDDIKQGEGLGDCYFLAGLSSMALTDPEDLMQSIAPLGDGTYGIRFYRDGAPHYLRIDADIPELEGEARYAGFGEGDSTWVMLLEKAYAMFRDQESTSYSATAGGALSDPFATVAGLKSAYLDISSSAQASDIEFYNFLNEQLSSGKAVTLGSRSEGGPMIAGDHTYSLISIQETDGVPQAKLYNTWGYDGVDYDANPDDGLVTIDISGLREYFSYACMSEDTIAQRATTYSTDASTDIETDNLAESDAEQPSINVSNDFSTPTATYTLSNGRLVLSASNGLSMVFWAEADKFNTRTTFIEIYTKPGSAAQLASGAIQPAATLQYSDADISVEKLAAASPKFDYSAIKTAVEKASTMKTEALNEFLKSTLEYYVVLDTAIKENSLVLEEAGIDVRSLYIAKDSVAKMDAIDAIVAQMRKDVEKLKADKNASEMLALEKDLRSKILDPAAKVYGGKIKDAVEYMNSMVQSLMDSQLALYMNSKEEKIDVIIKLQKRKKDQTNT